MKDCLLVDDLPDALALMSAAVSRAFPHAHQHHAQSYADAVEKIKHTHFDLALIDLALDEGHGSELITLLGSTQPNCISIVSTIFDDDHNLFNALQAGAQGYLLKDHPVEVLSMQLLRIEQGEPPLSPTLARRLIQHFRTNGKPAINPAEMLSGRETEVLKLLANGLRTVDVAQVLNISRHTAADHIKAIYRKLNISSRAEAALHAKDMGLLK